MRNFFLLFFVLLAGCVKKERFTYKGEKGGTLIVATFEEPSNLNPLYPPIGGFSPVTYLLFSSIHKTDKLGKVMPCISSQWEFSEDLKKIVYYIDKKAKWSDGTQITQKDIMKTFEFIRDPKNNYPLVGRLRYIKNIKPVGKDGIEFEFSMVYADEILNSNLFPLPEKILIEKSGYPEFRKKVEITSGPYRLNEWKEGEYIELLANENYIYGRPLLDRIVFWFPKSIDELKDEMNLGHINLVLNFPPDKVKDISIPSYKTIIKPGNVYTFVGWNLTKFSDKRLRVAFSMAIDKAEIIEKILRGSGEISYGPIPQGHWAYDEGMKSLSIGFNPEKAIDIIRSLGYVDKNRDKYFDNLSVEFLVDQNDEMKVAVAEMISNYLKKIGVQSTIKKIGLIDFISRLEKGDFSAFILSWNVTKEFEPAPIWSSTGMYNFIKYNNPQIENLIEKGILTLDRRESKKIWSEFQKIIVDDVPYTFLFVSSNIGFVREGVEGIDSLDKRLVSEKIDELFIPSSSRPTTSVQFSELGKHFRETSNIIVTKKAPPILTAEELLTSRLLSQPVDTSKKPEKKLETTTTTTTTQPEVKSETKEEKPIETPQEVVKELPKAKDIFWPSYPEAAQKLNLKGTVFVKVVVDENGNVVSAEVIKTTGAGICDEVAIEAAKRWKFIPGKVNGVPTKMETTLPFNFPPPGWKK